MRSRIGEKIKLTSYNDLLGISGEENSIEVELSRILPFKNHPFKVNDDEKMEDLVRSIRENGVLSPILVRPCGVEKFETISGHRRVYACNKVGMRTIPAIIREMSDEEAIIAMVDANIQREELLPSERAFAFRMKMEALAKQGQRTDLTSRHNVEKWSCDSIGDESGISGRQVNRYIRLTYLIPELLKMVDNKRISMTMGITISYFEPEVQQWLYEYIKENGDIKKVHLDHLQHEVKQGAISQQKIIQMFNSYNKRSNKQPITLAARVIQRYFPDNLESYEIEEIIVALIEQWSKEKNGGTEYEI